MLKVSVFARRQQPMEFAHRATEGLPVAVAERLFGLVKSAQATPTVPCSQEMTFDPRNSQNGSEEPQGGLRGWAGRILCLCGLHDFHLIEVVVGFGAGGQVQRLRCRRCGFIATRRG